MEPAHELETVLVMGIELELELGAAVPPVRGGRSAYSGIT